ncbi:MAG TPA: hypothetical protein G4O11_07525 [Anaerolineae bacterium]|nr:MAG: hypothetical protein AMJ88_17075 [Anaerolineae bacterium SM23_ 63]HEY43816.1 hypothetical protein [Anaerolineae bacterium]
MDRQFSDRMKKVQKLIKMAKVDKEIQEKLKSGDKELVMPVLKEAGLSEKDVEELVGDLDTISTSVTALGFWRFGA